MKQELREQARKNRDKISSLNKGIELRDNFTRNIQLPPHAIIGAYWPIGSEIDVRPLITALYDSGQEICLPTIVGDGQPLNFRTWEPEAVMVKSKYKIFEPCAKNHDECTPDVIIVPLLAFDKNLHRLGYGGGFYDRTIEKLRKENPELMVIGVAFAQQEIEKIPNEDWDVQLDKIVTETKVYG